MIPTYTFIIGVDVEDCSSYLSSHTTEVLGAPVLVSEMSQLLKIDQTDRQYQILKTPAYNASPEFDRAEEIMLAMKAANYTGPVIMVEMLGVMFPCMEYDLSLSTHKEDWPAEVPSSYAFHGTVTTIHGRVYKVFCGTMSLRTFRGKLLALALGEPFLYTGGFA